MSDMEQHLQDKHEWSYSMVRAIWTTKGGQHAPACRARFEALHAAVHDRVPQAHDRKDR